MTELKNLSEFANEFKGTVGSFMEKTAHLSLDDFDSKQVYCHASYIHNVIGDYDELVFSGSDERRTFWTSEVTNKLFSVKTLDDEGFFFTNAYLSDEGNEEFNREHQESFRIFHSTTIRVAKEIVEASTSKATRERLRRVHTEFAQQALGIQNPQLGPLYGYHGSLPFGITWGKTDVTKARVDDDKRRAQYYRVIELLWENFGEYGLDRGLWEVEHYHSWASPFDQISIQYFFSEGHDYLLTPIALYYFENIYNQWDEVDLNPEDYL